MERKIFARVFFLIALLLAVSTYLVFRYAKESFQSDFVIVEGIVIFLLVGWLISWGYKEIKAIIAKLNSERKKGEETSEKK